MEPIFWQNTLPLMVTILVAVGGATAAGRISNTDLSKRIDDVNFNLSKRLDEVIVRLDRIEIKLEDHQERIARLEERTSPIHRN